MTPAQQQTLLALCLILIVALGIQQLFDSTQIPDPPTSSSRAHEIEDRLDPNVADADALSAIPGLGEIKARDIVSYRESFITRHPGQHAFQSSEDLMMIKGIGPGITTDIAPYLMFASKQ